MTNERTTNQLIEILQWTPVLLKEIVDHTEEALYDRAWSGEWTPRTVLAHLRDNDQLVMRACLERILTEEQPILIPFDGTSWVEKRCRERDALSQLLDDFCEQRATSIQLLLGLDANQWARSGYQSELGELNIHIWVEHWITHDQEHINQLRAGLGLTA